MNVTVNFVAVILAMVASMALGFLWYGPLFGKPWMKMLGMSKESMEKSMAKGMGKTYALMTLGSFFMVYTMAHSMAFAMAFLKIDGVNAGVQGGFWNWLGFVAPVVMGAQLWEGKPWKLFAINAGYYLVSLCMIGTILALMPA